MSKLLKKGSKAAKAWGAKMRRLRGRGKKRKNLLVKVNVEKLHEGRTKDLSVKRENLINVGNQVLV